jgi:hypothetical protein
MFPKNNRSIHLNIVAAENGVIERIPKATCGAAGYRSDT